MSDRDVIVLGGTGFLGWRVVRRLLEQGRRVVVATRSPEKAARPTGNRATGHRRFPPGCCLQCGRDA